MSSLFSRVFRQDKTARLAERAVAAEAALEEDRRQHDATVVAIRDGIGTEIAAAPQCSHNLRPSCGKCQYRAGLAKALEIARETGELR
jgi:hypothetical protein